jgi:hypothetical protein
MTESEALAPQSPVRRRAPLLGTVVVGIVCAVAGAAAAGLEGLGAAVLGSVLVVTFFATGIVPLHLADAVRLRAGSGVLLQLLTYVLRWVLVVAVLAVAGQSEVVHVRTLGLTVIACGLTWSLVHAVAFFGRPRGT